MIKNLRENLHYLFIPSEKNNFRARTLQHDFLTYYLAVAFVFVFIFRNFGATLTDVLGIATDITTEKLNEYVNVERQQKNLPPLRINQKLSDAASKKASDMFAKNYWAHSAPDGATPWDFILSSGYSYELAGENLAKNFLFSKNVVDAWIQSPTHRENLLRADYTEVGYAIVNGVLNGEQTTLVVQLFGKPSVKVAAIPQPQPQPGSSFKIQGVSASELSALQGKVSPTNTSSKIPFYTTGLFIAFLIFVIVLDLYVAARLNVLRINGKSLAHFIFLITVFSGLLFFIAKGSIL